MTQKHETEPEGDEFESGLFVRASKRSITIAGHPTSIRIESPFWDIILAQAESRGLPVSALVAQIDASRLAADDPPNLASAIRLWVLAYTRRGATAPVGDD